MSRIFKVGGQFTNTSLPFVERFDSWLGTSGNTTGVIGIYDVSKPPGWTGGTPIVGSTVSNIIPGNNATVYSVGAGALGIEYVGGGFDLSNIPAGAIGRGIQVPSGAFEQLANAASWLFCAYVKLPSAADWNANAAIFPIIQAGDSTYNVAGNNTLFLVTLTTGNNISIRGITGNAVGAQQVYSSIDSATEAGQVAQIGVWYQSGTLFTRIRTLTNGVSGRSLSSAWAGQSLSMTGRTLSAGTVTGFATVPSTTPKPQNGLRYYRLAMENLTASGRNPTTVLDFDFQRAMSRMT